MKDFNDEELIDGVPADEILQEGEDDIVTLLSATGEEIDFVEIAGIAHKGNFYAILQPVELIEGMADDEALVFKVSRGPNGEDKFEIELNDEIIDAVFTEYNRLLDSAMADNGDGDI
ncbi:MAG: DUF1292 domain-containing protein [Clostridia bacterium]|nr:DUF1292 domain-containing protein [Clostridia bacterium]